MLYSCTHMATVGVKGFSPLVVVYTMQNLHRYAHLQRITQRRQNAVCVTGLRPVVEDLSVSSVRDEFLWILSDSVVKVVHYHVHQGGGVETH